METSFHLNWLLSLKFFREMFQPIASLLIILSIVLFRAEFGAAQTLMNESESLQQSLSSPDGQRGLVVRTAPGKYLFRPSDVAIEPIPIVNPAKVPTLALGIDVLIKGTLAQDKISIETIEAVLPEPDRLRSVTPSPALATARSALQNLRNEAITRFSPGAMSPDDLKSTLDVFFEQRMKLIDACVQARRNSELPRVRGQIAGVVADIRRTEIQLKTQYGQDENFPAWIYDRIYTNAHSVVAVGEVNALKPHCSGVLIAPNLVLTAGHCFASVVPNESEIWFDYWDLPDGSKLPPKKFPVRELVAPESDRHAEFFRRARYENSTQFDKDFLDYAIVRFETGGGTDTKPKLSPLCLDARPRLPRERAIYVIGYPGREPIRVHDSGRIYLPFYATNTEVERWACEVEVDFSDRPEAEREAVVARFFSSYRNASLPGTDFSHLFADAAVGGQPMMGIAADTAGGTSGGAVFDRESNSACVSGLFIAGRADSVSVEAANFKVFERAMPICAIVSDLRSRSATRKLIDELRIKNDPIDPQACR